MKNAMMNSSNETVKHSRRLATIPGKTTGSVTRQKVPHAVSPRSADTSSIDLSKPSKRGIKVATANGMQRIVWPRVTV